MNNEMKFFISEGKPQSISGAESFLESMREERKKDIMEILEQRNYSEKHITKNEGEMLDYIMRNLTPTISVIFLNETHCNHYRNDTIMIKEFDDEYVQCQLCGHKISRNIIKEVYSKLKELVK